MEKLKELARDAKDKEYKYFYVDADGAACATNQSSVIWADGVWIDDDHANDDPWVYLGYIEGEWNEHNSKFVVADLLQDDTDAKLKELARDAKGKGYKYVYIDADGDAFATNCSLVIWVNDEWADDDHVDNDPWVHLGCVEGEWNEHNSKFVVDDLLQDKGCNDSVQHTPSINAISTLEETIKTIGERGQHYDSGEERSIPKVVNLFNELTGKDLTIKDGYRFMMLLKLVRGTQGQDKLDNYIDLAGYAALCSEVYNG